MPCILIVDDEPMIRDFIKAHLRRFPTYRVVAAQNGREALDLIEQEPELALLITDVLMPDIDGIDLIRAAHRRRAPSQILAISTGGRFRSEVYLDNAELLGAHATLSKPFTGDELVRAIAALLGTAVPPFSRAQLGGPQAALT